MQVAEVGDFRRDRSDIVWLISRAPCGMHQFWFMSENAKKCGMLVTSLNRDTRGSGQTFILNGATIQRDQIRNSQIVKRNSALY